MKGTPGGPRVCQDRGAEETSHQGEGRNHRGEVDVIEAALAQLECPFRCPVRTANWPIAVLRRGHSAARIQSAASERTRS